MLNSRRRRLVTSVSCELSYNYTLKNHKFNTIIPHLVNPTISLSLPQFTSTSLQPEAAALENPATGRPV
jgi:hypothetical protein